MAVQFRLDKVLEARKDGMSQSELSRRCGLSLTTVNAIVLNKSKQVSLATLDSLCAVLDVPPGDLFEWRPDRRGKGR
jgi:DNA-binding Xre family transcriptional regulator